MATIRHALLVIVRGLVSARPLSSFRCYHAAHMLVFQIAMSPCSRCRIQLRWNFHEDVRVGASGVLAQDRLDDDISVDHSIFDPLWDDADSLAQHPSSWLSRQPENFLRPLRDCRGCPLL